MPAADDERHGEAQRQRQKPLLAARGRRPRIGPPEAHGDVVAMRAEPRQPSPEIARPAPRPARRAAPDAWPRVPPPGRPTARSSASRRPRRGRARAGPRGPRPPGAPASRAGGARSRCPSAASCSSHGARSRVAVGPAHEIAQEARALLERQSIAAARLGMRGQEPGRRAVQIGAPQMGAAREQAPGRTPRSSRRRPTGRASLAPRPLPRARAARAAPSRIRLPAASSPATVARPPASQPRQSASLAVRKDRPVSRTWSASRSDVLPWPLRADENVQPRLRSEGERSVAPKPDQLDPSDVHPGRASPHMRIGIITQRYVSSGVPLLSAAPSKTPGLRPSLRPTTVHGWSIGPSASST